MVLGELDAGRQPRSRYRAVNSCIRLLPTIDGQELVTVESLQAADGSLHPVQQAMVDHHGSQCGFCTPGFVMSLFALYLQQRNADARAGARGPVRESVSLHRLSPDHRGRAAAWAAIRSRRTGVAKRRARSGAPRSAARRFGARRPLRLPGFYAPRSVR